MDRVAEPARTLGAAAGKNATVTTPSPIGEFDLIARWFRPPVRRARLGGGDDCALLAPEPGTDTAVSTDLLVEGRHFLSTVDPEALGHKALAVNLSDLAACGATPRSFLLALALPAVDAGFLEGFSRGLLALADAHGCELVGGDTTRGPLTIGITVFGAVPTGTALLRSGARVGDEVWASGTLGDARLALEVFRGTVALPGDAFAAVRRRMERPTPRVALGERLRGIATAAIDVSDGLSGDLRHVLAASSVGATLDVDALPTGRELGEQVPERRRRFALAGGDDYELCFTAPAARRDDVARAAASADVAVTRIGRVEAEPGLRLVDRAGDRVDGLDAAGFDHFLAP